MSKKRKAKPVKEEKKLSREEQLEREIELLRLENAYLKKLRAFQENPNAFPRKAQAALAFELKEEGFRLKDVLVVVSIPEATYHYQARQLKRRIQIKNGKRLFPQESYPLHLPISIGYFAYNTIFTFIYLN
ncbi:hypothetical protein ACTNDN_20775 [Niallia sp. HCP3S3_B10]|uniref:hypothetical protein n=1 Tax=Niallia sp. HCP3S3_B10 TaxID=3438944 RepID=UPI003F8ACEE6